MLKALLERLRKRSEFLIASQSSRKWITPAFIVQIYNRTNEGPFRYGITASRKVGGAVDRNRAKRRLRALLRNTLPQFAYPGTDYVFVARKEILKRNFHLMSNELSDVLRKLES